MTAIGVPLFGSNNDYLSDASMSDEAIVIVSPLDDASRPAWLPVVASRLQEISSLKDDWDGNGSPAPIAQFLILSFDRVGSLIPADAPTPSIYPTTIGGVQFEWTVGSVHIELECLPDGSIEAWGEESESGTFWEAADDELTDFIRPALRAIGSQPFGAAGVWVS